MTKADLLRHCAKQYADEHPEDKNARETAAAMERIRIEFKRRREAVLLRILKVLPGTEGHVDPASELVKEKPPAFIPKVFKALKLDMHRPILEQLEEAVLESGDESGIKWLETYIWKRPGIGLRFDPQLLVKTLSRKKRRRAESI